MHNNTKPCIGIIGDGQLALMLAEALSKKQIKFCCLSASQNSPMEKYFPQETTSDRALFHQSSTVFTLENEFLTALELSELLNEKTIKLFPEIESYSHFADKIAQRTLFDKIGLRSPKWMPLLTPSDLKKVQSEFTYPFILKASQGGYDGKGVRQIKNPEDLSTALKDFRFDEGRPLLVEEKVQLKKEVAQGFLRNQRGDYTLLPLVDTVQEDGVCNLVYYPADVSGQVTSQIQNMLQALINFPLIGIFNFEFFVDDQDVVTINEGAPRPHNSQHLTINASEHSQFDLLAMYLTDNGPLPKTIQTKSSAMINILGQSSAADYHLTLPLIDDKISIHPKLYGKEKCLPGRKMGHVNIVDESGKSNLKEAAKKILREYKI